MTTYNLRDLNSFCNGKLSGNPEQQIAHLAFDSRKIISPRNTLFIALKTESGDGHSYIQQAYDKGVRSFLVLSDFQSNVSEASFIAVQDTLLAVQNIAKHIREELKFPLLAITGSNGKTTVKEWLLQVLQPSLKASANPRSFNSQLGVPLSLWGLDKESDLGIIEAGISRPSEMEVLQDIIRPELGIFVNLGTAHLQNFHSQQELLKEKMKLFSGCETMIINADDSAVLSAFTQSGLNLFTWGKDESNDVQITFNSSGSSTEIEVKSATENFELYTDFTDDASLQNIGHVIAFCLLKDIPIAQIKSGVKNLSPLEMRLEVLNGINNCTLINDAYTTDVHALENALSLAKKYDQKRSITLVISAYDEVAENTYSRTQEIIKSAGVKRLITIGKDENLSTLTAPMTSHYSALEDLLNEGLNDQFLNEVIVIKGARKFKLERLAHRLQLKDHQTVLDINLTAFTENLNYYKSLISDKTNVMAMVKAFSYGSGSYEVAAHLENAGVDYLAVAYADEGVALRKKGISIPILVLNPEVSAISSIIRYDLEPEIYSLELIRDFKTYLEFHGGSSLPVHLKLDSGMHRLGMEEDEMEELLAEFDSKLFKVISVFSHLSASESPEHDEFTINQLQLFTKMCTEIKASLGYDFIKHISNSAALERFPEAHLDMVRLGIGLYGISSQPHIQNKLKLTAKLRTTIIRTRWVKAGESFGYGRRFKLEKDMRLAIIPIGYADGLHRSLGNGRFQVKIGRQTAPIVGSVCMDMAFVDVTHCTAEKGDEVLIFNSSEDIHSLAKQLDTIPYEVLTSVGDRVNRKYYLE